MSESSFADKVRNAVFLIAMAFILFGVIYISVVALRHENFVLAPDATGQMLVIPSDAPVLSPALTGTISILLSALGVIFGSVVGVNVQEAYWQDDSGRRGGLGEGQRKNIFSLPLSATQKILSKMLEWNPRYVAVIVYLLALLIASVVFVIDGGLNTNPGTIPVELGQMFQSAIGVVIGVVTSFSSKT